MKWGVRKKYEPSDRESGSLEKKKSKHRLKLEEKYRSKGISQEDAEKAATRRIRAEKFVAVAGVITVTAAMAVRTVTLFKTENDIQENMKHIFDTARNNGVTSLSDLPIIKNDHDMIDDLKATNPRFPIVRPAKWGEKYSVWEKNCGFCATAFEMRRRGFDVEAVSNGEGMTPLTPLSLFKNPITITSTPTSAYENIRKESLKWGKGARGYISVGWKGGGRHAFSFENTGDHASVQFIDPQVNNSNVINYFADASSVRFMRLDNLELTDKMLDAVKIKRR